MPVPAVPEPLQPPKWTGGAGLALIISSAELTGHGPGPGKAAELKQPPKCSGGAGLTWIISVSKLSGGDTAGKAVAGDPETPALLQPKGYEGEGKGRSGMDQKFFFVRP